MQRKCISAVLWQNPIKNPSNFHPNVFNSFFWIVIHGEYHRIIYKEILLSMVTPKSSQIDTCHFNGPPPSLHPLKQVLTWTQSLITNFLSLNSPQFSTSQITISKIYWSPQPRFPIACSNFFYKVIKFSPWVSLNVNRTTISPIIMSYRTPGLTHLLGRQGKHVWLIVRQPPMKMNVRCSPRAPGFSRSNLHVCQNLIFMSSLFRKVGFCLANVFFSKMFVCHCLLVTVDWHRCWMHVDVFPHIIMVSKITHSHVTLRTEE